MTRRDNFRLVRVMLAAPSNLVSVCLAPIVSIVTAVIGEELCLVCCDRVSRVQITLSSRPFREAVSTLRLVSIRDWVALILGVSNDTYTVKDDNGRWDPGYITGSSRHIKANINQGIVWIFFTWASFRTHNRVFSVNNVSICV